MQVRHQQPSLQTMFPEAANGVDLAGLFDWASQFGVTTYPNPLAPHDPTYDLMRLYNLRSDLQAAYPDAENAVGLAALYCWADWHNQTLGAGAHPLIAPHAAFYDLQCPSI